jgi:hypothetical protein
MKITEIGFLARFHSLLIKRKIPGWGMSLHRVDRAAKFAIPSVLDRESFSTFCDGRSARLGLREDFDDRQTCVRRIDRAREHRRHGGRRLFDS